MGSFAPIASFVIARTRFCSSKVHDATSVECALTVIAESPSTEATSARWARSEASSIDRSSLNGSSTAGMTPWGTHVMAASCSFDPDIVVADHLRPLVGLGARKGEELLGSAADHVEALPGKLASHLLVGERLPRLARVARDRLLRHA